MHSSRGSVVLAGLVGIIALAAAVNCASASTYKVLYLFCTGDQACPDGTAPSGNLVADSAGNLYGTTSGGGPNFSGTIFEMLKSGSTYKHRVLYSFCPQHPCTDGTNPQTAMIMDTAGNLYGTATQGGVSDRGTVFELSPDADHKKWTFKVLINFCEQTEQTCVEGEYPLSPLTYAGASTGVPYDGVSPLYGTTEEGGTSQAPVAGVAYRLTANGGSWTGADLYSFCSADHCTDGAGPTGQLMIDGSGILYGTTLGGGSGKSGGGTAYRLDTITGSQTVLHSFYANCKKTPCADGFIPGGGVIMGTQNKLYGTTSGGGKRLNGIVYAMDPTSGKEQILYTFCKKTNCADGGENPYIPPSPLIEDSGSLIGSVAGGGIFAGNDEGIGNGVLFRLDAANKEHVLYAFCQQSNCADGGFPVGIIADNAGHLFGITNRGGNNDNGLVFELLP